MQQEETASLLEQTIHGGVQLKDFDNGGTIQLASPKNADLVAGAAATLG